jgi:hypothetical protein
MGRSCGMCESVSPVRLNLLSGQVLITLASVLIVTRWLTFTTEVQRDATASHKSETGSETHV